MHVGAAQLFVADALAGGRLDQRRAAEVDGRGAAHHDDLVAHGGHIGATSGRAAEDNGELGQPGGAELGHVVKNASEVFAVGEDLLLHGQEGAAGVDQVDAGQAEVGGDGLQAQVFLEGDGEVAASLDGWVVGHDGHGLAGDDADAGDYSAGGAGTAFGEEGVTVALSELAVESMSGEHRELEEGRPGVEELRDALSDQELAPLFVARSGFWRAAGLVGSDDVGDRAPGGFVVLLVGGEGVAADVELGAEEQGVAWGRVYLRGDSWSGYRRAGAFGFQDDQAK